MQRSKKISIIVFLVVMAIYTGKVIFNPESKIKYFVRHNHEDLVTIAEDYLSSMTTIKKYKSVEVERIFKGKNDIVQFYYCGIGIAPASQYYGFYYSPDDMPTAYQNADYKLFPISDEEWEWSDGTDNGGRTSRIMKNWFYYEAWF